MESKDKSHFIGGMASPDSASNFVETNKPQTTLSCVARDVKNDIVGIFEGAKDAAIHTVSIPYNLAVRAPVHAVTKTARTAFNAIISMPAAGHVGVKKIEDFVDYPVTKKKEDIHDIAV